MKNILFAGHDFKFAKFIIDHFNNKPEYNIEIDKWEGHSKHDEAKSMELLKWADIIFCEWGLGNALWYSNKKKKNQKLIVRIHSQELTTLYPTEFNIKNIDTIIAISPYIYEELSRIFKIPRSKMKMIYNMIDFKKLQHDKIEGYNYNLGMVGIIPKAKRLDIAINIFENLYEKDKHYKLYIKGKLPSEVSSIINDEDEINYYNDLFERILNSKCNDNIIFEGFKDDIDLWFKKIGYVLYLSDLESFHLPTMEGAASGACPMVLKRDGADTIYEDDWIFDSEDEVINKIIDINQNGINVDKIKKYVKKNFDKEDILKEYEKLFI